jgi:hypothetical protein
LLLPAPGQLIDDVLDEQRIAAGQAVDGVLDLARRLWEPEGAHHLSGLFGRQRTQREAMTDLFPLEPLDVGRQPCVRRVTMRRREHHGHRRPHGGVGNLQREVREEVERGAVGPVEVVDDDQQRSALRQPDRRGRDGDEDARLRLLRRSRLRRFAALRALRVVAEEAFDDRRVPTQRRVLPGQDLQLR